MATSSLVIIETPSRSSLTSRPQRHEVIDGFCRICDETEAWLVEQMDGVVIYTDRDLAK